MKIVRKALVALCVGAVLLQGVEAREDNVHRIAGEDRYETAALLSQEAYTSADTVLIASGETPFDALSGGPLSIQEEAPILLTERDALPESTRAELRRLNPKSIRILGGENTVSESVEKELADIGDTV